jgi:cytidylate kinase
MSNAITIAIDGFSACGKSTLARDLAQRLGYTYIDTGAMYRAVSLYLLRHRIPDSEPELVEEALPYIHLDFRLDEEALQRVQLNEEDVEDQIRTLEVGKAASRYCQLPGLRQAMVIRQQRMAEAGGVVMDGRDIGTVVFPQAELKIFMTAAQWVRIERRMAELAAKGQAMDRAAVAEDLAQRDYADTHRSASPLRRAEDALELDNTDLSRAQQTELALRWAYARINGPRADTEDPA